MRTYVTAYPWDLSEEGVDVVMDRISGELGASGAAVWLAVPSVSVLRSRDAGPRMSRYDGGLYFHPNEHEFHASRLKPQVAPAARGRCVISALARSCRERGLEWRLIVSASRAGLFARRHEEFACKNVWGMKSLSTICLVNPDVQAYLVALLKEGRDAFPGASFELRDWRVGAYDVFDERWQSARELTQTETALLSICCCESCFQLAESAGVDAEAVHRLIQTMVEQSISQATAPPWRTESLLAESPLLADYLTAQVRALRGLLSRMVESEPVQVLLEQAAGVPFAPTTDQELPVHALPLWTVASADVLESKFLRSANRKSHLRWPVEKVVASGQDLVAHLARAANLGAESAEIDGYGLLPESTMTILKQALRFSRRRSGSE